MKNKKNDTIDLIKIISKIFKSKTKIIYITIIFSFLGITYALIIPNKFESFTKFYPNYDNMDNNNSDLMGLAGLAGININSNTSNNIPTSIYPEILKSNLFKKEILKTEFDLIDKKFSYKEYLLNQTSLFGDYNFLQKSIITLKNLIKKNDYTIIENDNLEYISEVDNYLFKLLDNKIKLEINEENNFIKLSIFEKNPKVSAIIAKKANDLLQKNIIEYKLKNINEVFEFTSSQLEISKNNLYKIQDSLANFRDSNKSIKSDIFLNKLNRLETEVNILKNVYNELAITKEKIAIDVKKNTPIFTVIDSVFVPIDRYSPNRRIIVMLFAFFGFIFGTMYILFKRDLKNLFNEIKK